MPILPTQLLVLGISAVMRRLVVGAYPLKPLAVLATLVVPFIILANLLLSVAHAMRAETVPLQRSDNTRVTMTKAAMDAYTTLPRKDAVPRPYVPTCQQSAVVHSACHVKRGRLRVQSCAGLVPISVTVDIALSASHPVHPVHLGN